MENKPNAIIASFRLFFGFCPNCNSDAPKKYTCKICNNGEVKRRKELSERFDNYDLIYMPDEEKKKVLDCIEWLLDKNNFDDYEKESRLKHYK